jgi:hypothetical protein
MRRMPSRGRGNGAPEDGLGKAFVFRGEQYKVTGYKPGCKYNVTAERVRDGRGFKFEAISAFKDCESAKRMHYGRLETDFECG